MKSTLSPPYVNAMPDTQAHRPALGRPSPPSSPSSARRAQADVTHPGRPVAARLSLRRRRLPAGAMQLNRYMKVAAGLQQPQPCGSSKQQGNCERLAYRRRDLTPFEALVRPSGPVPSPRAALTPGAVALLWLQGDVALIRARPEPAKQRWWAAATLSQGRGPQWQDELLRALVDTATEPLLQPPQRALALLHAEQVRVSQESRRWFTRSHQETLRQVLAVDPLQYLARFMLAANDFIEQRLAVADRHFGRAVVEMRGCLAGASLLLAHQSGPGQEPAQWHSKWQWLANLWPHEPLFAYAAATAASEVFDYRAALAHEHDIVQALPHCIYVYQAMGQTYVHLDQYEDGLRAWRMALDLGLDHPIALRAVGALEARTGAAGGGWPRFVAAAADAANPVDAHLDDATACMRVGALEAALASLLLALAQQPDCSAALINACTCLRHLHRPLEALALLEPAYLRAQQAGGSDHLTALNLGRLYADLGRASEAAQAFGQAAAGSCNPLAVHVEAGSALSHCGAAAAARVHFHKALLLAPQAVKHGLNAALTYLEEDRGAEALALLVRLTPPAEHLSEHRYLMAVARKQVGQIGHADGLYDEAIRLLGPDGVNNTLRTKIMCEAVSMLLDSGRISQALRRAQAYLELEDDDYLHLLCAQAAMKRQHWQLSVTEALRCLELNPAAADPWRILFSLPEETPGRPSSLTCLEHMADAHPNTFTIQWLLALEALDEGAADLALRAAHCAVLLLPGHSGAREALLHAQILASGP